MLLKTNSLNFKLVFGEYSVLEVNLPDVDMYGCIMT